MSYPSLLDIRARPDARDLPDQSLSDGLLVAVELVESYCRRGFGDTVDPVTGAVVPVATPASIRLCVAVLAVRTAAGAWSRLPDSAVNVQTEMGLVTLGQAQPDPAKGRPTGIAELDQILNRYRVRPPEVG